MNEDRIRLNMRSKEAFADQLQGQIRQLIDQGTLLPGERLPAVRELAERLQINFNTVARAYRVLDEQGWITTRQGRGTFILNREATDDRPAPTPQLQEAENEISRLVTALCAAAKHAGLPASTVHKIIDTEMREIFSEHHAGFNHRPRITRKKKYASPQWELPASIGHPRKISKRLRRRSV